MAEFFGHVGLSFVPLFVAVDALGAVPVVLALFSGETSQARNRMVRIATITAGAVGLLFLFLGQFVLEYLAISVSHFAIAGGIILMVLALRELVGGGGGEVIIKEELSEVVPIGTPLLAGPATITTLLVLADSYRLGAVLTAFVINLLLAWVILRYSGGIAAFLGRGGLRAASKIAYMFLAAIAVRMVVQGVQALLG